MPVPPIPPAAPKPLASRVTRAMVAMAIGGSTTVGAGAIAKATTRPPDADGTSYGRRDRAEAKAYFSGPTAPATIIPLLGALLCVPLLYGKARVILDDAAAPMRPQLARELATAGAARWVNEGPKTQVMYGMGGAGFFGGLANTAIIIHDDDYDTRHFPAGSQPVVTTTP